MLAATMTIVAISLIVLLSYLHAPRIIRREPAFKDGLRASRD
jgi:hypothetical protein